MSAELNRAEYVKAMEIIVRGLNDEDLIEPWLMNGVADGDINSDTSIYEIVDLGYAEERTFKAITGCFLRIMKKAGIDGIYVGNVLVDDKSKWE